MPREAARWMHASWVFGCRIGFGAAGPAGTMTGEGEVKMSGWVSTQVNVEGVQGRSIRLKGC